MAMNLGPGVSRTLDPTAREFREIILQEGKPPMDSEFNLLQEMVLDVSRKGVLSGVPSGWLGNETNLMADYQTDITWSNWFRFGSQKAGEKQSVMWANVNGWLIPVAGTRTGTPPGSPNDTDLTNIISLAPPPSVSGQQRADFVFLEAWLARIPPNPSTMNKPRADSVYRYGNVEGGFNYLTDDLVDPSLGFETSQRIQLQYRIRVVPTENLSDYPAGFSDALYAKGAFDPTHPDTSDPGNFTFQNMRKELGDPGLWRAGDGTQNTLGTVDGYVYAIPICTVFRRNTIVWAGLSGTNLSGGVNRNPTAVDRSILRTFSTIPTLALPMTATSVSAALVSATNIPLPSVTASPVYVRIGDEIMSYQGITGTTIGNIVRGLAGTRAETHPAGAAVEILSSRPDGLFADQVAPTDILDLRHVVNPNGFDYQTLLKYNFDKLLKGELRANWKRQGGQRKGVFLNYQDCITGTGITNAEIDFLDGPDNLRLIYSDAIVAQPIELIVKSTSGTAPVNCVVTWGLSVTTVNRTAPTTLPSGSFWVNGLVLRVPVSQLKTGMLDVDQVRWCHEGSFRTEIRLEGDNYPIHTNFYTVTSTNADPTLFTSSDDLLITLGTGTSPFPTIADDRKLYIKVYALYGAGRGASRVADAVHSVALGTAQTDVLKRPASWPAGNHLLSAAHVPQWSKYADLPPVGKPGVLPVTAESYVDPASKTIVAQPYRRYTLPNQVLTQDGTAVNLAPTEFWSSSTGVTAGNTTTFTDPNAVFTTLAHQGCALVIGTGLHVNNRYTIVSVTNPTTLVLDRKIYTSATLSGISYKIYKAQGLMPSLKRDAVTAKWGTISAPGSDPLGLFSCSTDNLNPTSKNMYVSLPAHLVPKAGAVHVPILGSDVNPFSEGINYMFLAGKGASYDDAERNYVPYPDGVSYARFSTQVLTTPYASATYNVTFPYNSYNICGIRHFIDPRGMGRQGLELPPFYGVARLFGVYEAADYRSNGGSPYDATTREYVGAKATNLLRQDIKGPTFWVETDEDGDSTFILNAECLDLSRSPNPLASFSAGNYVVEASIFGFDRDAFVEPPTGKREVRIVLTRYGNSSAGMRQASQAANTTNRTVNINALITGPVAVLPAPMSSQETLLYNYSRTPYGGDAWGTQTVNNDTAYYKGPVTVSTAYQVASTNLDLANLSKPNPKAFEVLASMPFATTAGTGRIAGTYDASKPVSPLSIPGYEVMSAYPPASAGASRPNFSTGLIDTINWVQPYMSRYNGLISRLPLGALWRDKDFQGVYYNRGNPGHTHLNGPTSVGTFAGMASPLTPPQGMTSLIGWADGSSAPGNIIVQVDGSPESTPSPYINYRTHRGGSGFMGNGDVPGGWVVPGIVGTSAAYYVTNVLGGIAYLVRNTVTNKNTKEVSAGDELMLLVATQRFITKDSSLGEALEMAFSTVGVGEGDAALDHYRIEGHPLVRDNVGAEVNPLTISLVGP